MAISKVLLNDRTLVDMTDATAKQGQVLLSYSAYGADGQKMTGTRVSISNDVYVDEDGFVVIDPPNALEDNDVVFIDYDGTVVAGYSEEEFASIKKLPPNPCHDGLTSQGWNWSLADAKSYVQNNHYLVIGQLYVPTDGKTHIYVTVGVDQYVRPLTVQFDLRKNATTSSSNATYSWGDGSTDDTVTLGNSMVSTTHTYSNAGNYDITIETGQGLTAYLQSIRNDCINAIELGPGVIGVGISNDRGIDYCHYLKTVTFHNAFTTFKNYAFSNCRNLQAVVLPETVTSLGNYSFEGCNNVKYFSMSKSLSSMGNGAFGCSRVVAFCLPEGFSTMPSLSGFTHIKRLALPTTLTTFNTIQNNHYIEKLDLHEGLTKISNNGFRQNSILYELTIPSTVTSIGSSCFYQVGAKAFKILHVKATTPPTLAASDSISGLANDAVIYVPYSSDHSVLQAYLNDTNWATKSSLIQEEPQS